MTQADEAIERLRGRLEYPYFPSKLPTEAMTDIRTLLAEVARLRADMHKLAGYDFDTAAKIAIARAALQPQKVKP